MELNKVANHIQVSRKDELLKEADELKSKMVDEYSGERAESDQFAQSRKFESTTRGEAGTDSAMEESYDGTGENG